MKEAVLKNKKAAILTLGCKVNQYESDAMASLLEKAGCQLVDFSQKADIYIVNTCSVTNIADRKSRQMLHRAKKNNPEAVVVAAGCYVQADKGHAREDRAVDLVLGNNVKGNIVELLTEYYASGEEEQVLSFMDLKAPVPYEKLAEGKPRETTRAYMKVQDGCNQFCSYCIIPYTRGRNRSRAPLAVLAEASALADRGYKELVLTGIHLSSYGRDLEEAVDLGTLVRKVSGTEGILRVRLGSLEPGIITEDFLEGLRENDKFCPHFHLSLQSACNATLKRMNRKYTIEEYMEKCRLIRRYFENPAITTDIIVGFPGETEEEFGITVENLEKLNLYEMHVFKFSPRKGTAAEHMPDQVPDLVKTDRSNVLLEMSKRHQADYEGRFTGHTVSVLVEEACMVEGKRYLCGHTKNYIRVLLPFEENMENQIVDVCYLPPYGSRLKI